MTYPEELLPQLNFKRITADLSGYFICRKVLDKAILKQPLPPILPERLLSIETASDCFDYSTNLPGVFKLPHNKIEIGGGQKKYFREYWDWETEVIIPIYQQDFSINENTGWFFLPIEKIQRLTIPFSRKSDTATNETATAHVVHTPTNSNFWHFSIKWYDGINYISTTDSKWKCNIIATMRAMLSEIILLSNPGQEIPGHYYT